MSNSRKLKRASVVSTIRSFDQWKEEYQKLWEDYDYFVCDKLEKCFKRGKVRHVFFSLKEKVYLVVLDTTKAEIMKKLVEKYNNGTN